MTEICCNVIIVLKVVKCKKIMNVFKNISYSTI